MHHWTVVVTEQKSHNLSIRLPLQLAKIDSFWPIFTKPHIFAYAIRKKERNTQNAIALLHYLKRIAPQQLL